MQSVTSNAVKNYVNKETIINGINSGESNEIAFDFDSLETGVYEIYVYIGNVLKNFCLYTKWYSTIDTSTHTDLNNNCGESLSIYNDRIYTGSWYSIVYMYKVG